MSNDFQHPHSLDHKSVSPIDESEPLLPHKLPSEDDAKLSVSQAVMAIFNLFAGSVMLTFPFAFAQGGMVSLPMLAILSIGACHTAKLIVLCFNHPLVQPVQDYSGIGWIVFDAQFGCGWLGRFIISFCISLEFAGYGIANSIIIVRNIAALLPVGWINEGQLFIVLFLLTVPSVMTLSISEMKIVSWLGSLSHLSSSVCILAVCLLAHFAGVSSEDSDEHSTLDIWPRDARSLSVCVGIYIFSLSGHPILPDIYHHMRDPSQFGLVLDICFFLDFVLIAGLGFVGYHLFGRDGTSPVITESFATLEIPSGIIGSVLKFLFNALIFFISVGCFATIGPSISLISEVPEMMLGIRDNPSNQRVFRVIELTICMIVSFAVMSHLEYVYALSGSLLTMITSVIAPPLFHWILTSLSVEQQPSESTNILVSSSKLSLNEMVIYSFIIMFGLVFGIILVSNDIRGLIRDG